MSKPYRVSNRASLRYSIKDGAASAIATGVSDHYLGALALFLAASPAQIGWLVSLPALAGSLSHVLAVSSVRRGFPRLPVIVGGAAAQGAVLVPMALLPAISIDGAVTLLIVLAVLRAVAGNFIQPLWQSVMGDLTSERWRGRFFAGRTRLASLLAFAALVGGGLILDASKAWGIAWAGFMALFLIAAAARFTSVFYLSRMHDPGQTSAPVADGGFHPRSAFLRFALFVAGMHGATALGGPFFGVHLLRDLQFTYVEFMSVISVSVFAQFATLNAWGGISDRFGNRLVLRTASWIIPTVPMLWLWSDSVWWFMAVQTLGGLAWAGFSLSSGNYLYDLRGGRPRLTMFAISAVISGVAVFSGGVIGGYLADRLPMAASLGDFEVSWNHPLYGVFLLSGVMRLMAVVLLMRGMAELRDVAKGGVRQVIYRLARFNSVSGVMFDLVATARKPKPERRRRQTGRGSP
ncbi:MAG: hypothetical protein HQL36_01365 [Alphaproteobacteria bacterium]|nr:hypothetical protein [Alphaproteobacteria bacterium]